jgi:hypothetical protein
VETLIDNMAANDRMMLISFDAKPTVVAPFTSITSQLREALADVRARETGTDFAQAMALVASLAGNLRDAHLYVVSDGAFEQDPARQSGAMAFTYLPVGTSGDNLGIVAVDARRGGNLAGPEVFARIRNAGEHDRDVRVELYLNDDLLDAKIVRVPAGGAAATVFTHHAMQEGLARIELAADDALAADNHAWIELIKPRPVRTLLVTAGHFFLELAAKNDPLCDPVFMTPDAFEKGMTDGTLAIRDYDVILLDRFCPRNLPPGTYFILGAAPKLPGFIDKGDAEAPAVIDWDAAHPVNRHVGYGSLALASALALDAPGRAETLVDSTAGPLVLEYNTDTHRLLVAAFDVFESRWPLRVAFPVFFANALRYLGNLQSASDARVGAGAPIAFDAPPGTEEVALVRPEGATVPVKVRTGRVTYDDTGVCGPYKFLLGEGRARTWLVNLCDADESDVRSAAALEWKETRQAGETVAVRENRELWPWLALAGLAVLMLEWYIFNRRVYV